MPIQQTPHVLAARLRQELLALGMEAFGSRADLVNRLEQAGVYEINTDIPPKAKKQDTCIRFPNHKSVLIGNGAQLDCNSDSQLVICNEPNKQPLISGNFSDKTVNVDNCFHIKETKDMNAEKPGCEGDIRRTEDKLYMYRETNVHPGWYEIQFGKLLLI